MQPQIVSSALWLSGLAFAVFVLGAAADYVLKFRALPRQGQAAARAQPAGEEAAKLADAMARLAEAFAKAGPALSALVASIFFLLIAVLASAVPRTTGGERGQAAGKRPVGIGAPPPAPAPGRAPSPPSPAPLR